MQNNSRISCSECKFYFSLAQHCAGECRKNPPVIVDDEIHAVFPITNDLLYCGEFVRSAGNLQIEDTHDEDLEEDTHDEDLEDYYEDNSEQADLFDDFDNDPVDEDTPSPWPKDNPYEDWDNKDSAIDELVDRLDKVEDVSIDLEADVDALKNFRTWAMAKIEKLEKEVQVLKQPKGLVGNARRFYL